MSKVCTACGETKDATSEFFYQRKASRDGLHSMCKACEQKRGKKRYAENAAYFIEKAKEWQRRNPEKLLAYQKEYRSRPEVLAKTLASNKRNALKRRKYLREWKTNRGCEVCGYNEHYEALDFHHRDPDKKSIPMYSQQNYRWELVVKELEGCAVLCANCHRLYHKGIVSLPGKYFPFAKIVGAK